MRYLNTVEDYNSLIDSALESSRISRVEAALKEMQENKIEPNENTRNLLIEFANQNNKVEDAIEQYNFLVKNKNTIPESTITSLLRNFSRNNGAQYVDKVFSTIKEPNFKQYELAIKSYSEAGNFDAANKLFQQMKKSSVQITAPVYASMMKLASQKKDLNLTIALWEELKQRNVHPNLHHFDSLFYVYDAVGDMNGIEKTLQEVAYYDISPEGVDESRSFSLSLVRKIKSNQYQNNTKKTPPKKK